MSSCPINVEEAHQSRAISVADAAPGDTTLGTKICATGRRGIPVLVAPLESQSQSHQQQQLSRMGFQGFLLLEEKDDDDPVAQRKKWFKEMRGWLMVLATVAASVTYQAGLNPPGGFWQADDDQGHRAGNPVLRDQHWSRYMVFYYLNATAFVTSLVIMVLLMSERFYHTEAKLVALMLTTFVDLISLIGAYIAGTTRFFSSCIYVIVIACVAFAGVIYIGEVMAEMCRFFLRRMPCMVRLVQSRWFPVPADVVSALQLRQERSSNHTRPARNNPRGACSACCAAAPRPEG